MRTHGPVVSHWQNLNFATDVTTVYGCIECELPPFVCTRWLEVALTETLYCCPVFVGYVNDNMNILNMYICILLC